MIDKDQNTPLKLVNGIIYINAQYRRKILDKWVILEENKNWWDLSQVMRDILSDKKTDNPDIQFWVDYYKNLIGKKFRRKKYGASNWIKTVERIGYITSVDTNVTTVEVKVKAVSDAEHCPNYIDSFDLAEIQILD